MVLAKEKSWSMVQIQTDCKSFADDWKDHRDRSVGGPIMREMKLYLSSFQEFELGFIRRKASQFG